MEIIAESLAESRKKGQRTAAEQKDSKLSEKNSYLPTVMDFAFFDRISFLKLICEKHPLSAKMKKFLTPENYYEDCFGIYRMEVCPS